MSDISDSMVARLRTFVPALWGSILSWLLIHAAWLPEPVTDFLQEDVVTVLFTSLVILAWYWVWQRIEPRLPAWLTRLFMGSNQTPSYAETPDPDNDDASEAAGEPAILGAVEVPEREQSVNDDDRV